MTKLGFPNPIKQVFFCSLAQTPNNICKFQISREIYLCNPYDLVMIAPFNTFAANRPLADVSTGAIWPVFGKPKTKH